MNKVLVSIGLLVTVAYVAFGVWVLDDQLYQIKELPLNELGDFLAGVFGPLALLWLILGFFQQGIELRQTGRTLQLQAEELRNSVEQQRAMVSVAREQFDIEKNRIELERKPFFTLKEDVRKSRDFFKGWPADDISNLKFHRISFTLINEGAIANSVELESTENMIVGLSRRRFSTFDHNFIIGFAVKAFEGMPYPIHIKLEYCDMKQESHSTEFQIFFVKSEGVYSVEILASR